jgi:hypothetical protein
MKEKLSFGFVTSDPTADWKQQQQKKRLIQGVCIIKKFKIIKITKF